MPDGGLNSPLAPASATASKIKPIVFSKEDLLQKRSQAVYHNLTQSGPRDFKFDDLIGNLRLDDESISTVKDLATKRFIDMLFLNGTSQVSLQQSNPLAFSEINIHTNGF